jgi:hypothetical protein
VQQVAPTQQPMRAPQPGILKPNDTPTIEATPPGALPVIAPAMIVAKWPQTLKALEKYSTTGPAVLEQFTVLRVDGNLLYMGTQDVVYYKRLAGQDQKLKAISRALHDVHSVWLRVQVELMGDAARQGNTESRASEDPLLSAARDLGARVLPESPQD